MKKFTAMVKDNVSGKQMVLSECTYNQACNYLESRVDITKVRPVGKYMGLYCGTWFYYDEERGYLLQD